MFSVEIIPDESKLFIRVHGALVSKGAITAGAFKERGEGEKKGLSSDWDRYSTAEESRNRAANPEKNGVLAFCARHFRKLGLTVNHDPIEEDIEKRIISNQAHTNSKGLDVEIRNQLTNLANTGEFFAIRLPEDVNFAARTNP